MYSDTVTPIMKKWAERKNSSTRPLPFHIHIIGLAGAGKSTLAQMLSEYLGEAWCETSEILARNLAAVESSEGRNTYLNLLTYYREHKDFLSRRRLVYYADEQIALKADCLIADAAHEACIIVGTRREVELQAWLAHPSRVHDIVIEITREGAGKPGDIYELGGFVQQWGMTVQCIPVVNVTAEGLRKTAAAVADHIIGYAAALRFSED